MDKKESLLNNELTIIKEGSADFYVHSTDLNEIPSKSMKVFYNPKMEINRDISCLAINAYSNLYDQDDLIIVDSMAASGISSIRMIKECKKIKKIYINDLNPVSIELIKKNLSLNNLNNNIEVELTQKDANFLFSIIEQTTCPRINKSHVRPNVISIDPFGTPNLYIDGAFKTIQKTRGLICITATDTAVLFGVRPNACIRKYMAKSLRTEYHKEIGARILVHFISRIANINKLGIIPLLTLYSNHFIRVFALTFKNKKQISEMFVNYGYIIHCNSCGDRTESITQTLLKSPMCNHQDAHKHAGPLWLGKLHNEKFIKELIDLNEKSEYTYKKRIKKLLKIGLEEINMPGFYFNIHKLCQKLKLASVPKIEQIIKSTKEKGNRASRTHFDFLSIKTDMRFREFKKLLKRL